jgi:hypothetical protein
MNDTLENDVILHFKGQLKFDDISDLIHILKERMKVRQVTFGTYKKVLMLMIESLENILRYNKQKNVDLKILEENPVEFRIYLDQENYAIESSNVILNPDILELNERLEDLNKLDQSSIKELYKTRITDGKFSDSGGAGLGIIEMAKISDNKLLYSFAPIDDKLSYFTLRMNIHLPLNNMK